jgi:hypothetical protein
MSTSEGPCGAEQSRYPDTHRIVHSNTKAGKTLNVSGRQSGNSARLGKIGVVFP